MSDNRGFSLIELVIAGAIGAVITVAYLTNLNSFTRATNALTGKSLADAHAAELIESFRGFTSAEMKIYLTRMKEMGRPCMALPGDYNRDGSVGSPDVGVWSQEHQRLGTNTGVSVADGNGDGKVDLLDKQIILDNMQRPPSPCGPPTCFSIPGDLDRDGRVTTSDLRVATTLTLPIVQRNMGRVSTCGAPRLPASPTPPQPYRFCQKINPSDVEAQTQPYFYDSQVELPMNSGLDKGHRSLQIQLADMQTLTSPHCGPTAAAAESIDPGINEFYVVVSEVTWGDKGERVTLSMGIPNSNTTASDQSCERTPYRNLAVGFTHPATGEQILGCITPSTAAGRIGFDSVTKDRICVRSALTYRVEWVRGTARGPCTPVLADGWTADYPPAAISWNTRANPGIATDVASGPSTFLFLRAESSRPNPSCTIPVPMQTATFYPNFAECDLNGGAGPGSDLAGPMGSGAPGGPSGDPE